MLVQTIDLPHLTRNPGTQARLWYLQPALSLVGPPFQPHHQDGKPTGLQLLAATLLQARATPPTSTDAPTIIMLPECSIRSDEIAIARTLIRGAAANTVVVFGASQLDEPSARALEPEPGIELWDGASAGHFTNLAIIGFGGSDHLYMQPKIVRSHLEQDTHWPGRVVRYFRGRNVQFIVVICSELLNRPEGATTVHSIVDEVRARGGRLNLAIWLQHNPQPRSDDFADSIAEFRFFRTTVLVVASACNRQRRVNNYGVSGAIIPHDALPRHFRFLTRRFHYTEPISNVSTASRVVLLRYDAHVYRVDTVLAESIQPDDRASRGALFEESQPFSLEDGTLICSNQHVHLEDLTYRAMQRELCDAPVLLHEAIRHIRSRLVDQTTTEFLDFLDVGIAPRPRDEDQRHAAGVQHEGGDFLCCCWHRRECVDRLADDDESAYPLAEILRALAAMQVAGVEVHPVYNKDRRTNTQLNAGGRQFHAGIIHPFELNAEGTERALWGQRRASFVDSPYIVLGSGGRCLGRPLLADINPSRAIHSGAVRADSGTPPTLRALYYNEFWDAYEQGTLPNAIQRLSGTS